MCNSSFLCFNLISRSIVLFSSVRRWHRFRVYGRLYRPKSFHVLSSCRENSRIKERKEDGGLCSPLRSQSITIRTLYSQPRTTLVNCSLNLPGKIRTFNAEKHLLNYSTMKVQLLTTPQGRLASNSPLSTLASYSAWK